MCQKISLYLPNYRPDITRLKVISVFNILFYNIAPGWPTNDFVSIDIFFVISGYLMSMIFFKSSQNNSFNHKDFSFEELKNISSNYY